MAALSHHRNPSQLLYELLPAPWNANSDKFRSKLVEENVSKIGFLRHGQTAKSQGIDFDRLITDYGRMQAHIAGSSFGKELKPFYCSILCSPAPRTVETAKIFLDSSGETRNLVTPEILYDGTMQPMGSELFKTIGYAPLEDYLNHPDKALRTDARKVLGAYSHAVVSTIFNEVSNKHDIDYHDGASDSSASSTLWMVGHAIYLPAVALGVASLLGCNDCEVILQCNTKEAEGYLIDVHSSSVTYISRPTNGQI